MIYKGSWKKTKFGRVSKQLPKITRILHLPNGSYRIDRDACDTDYCNKSDNKFIIYKINAKCNILETDV